MIRADTRGETILPQVVIHRDPYSSLTTCQPKQALVVKTAVNLGYT